jgi:prolyl-tRNA editing enzyme YbaK/EbsC (Cys-tRNA(Pro) deacylase)
MPEVRFTIPEKLNQRILEVAEELGVDKSECIKSLILKDLRKRGGNK